MPSERTRRPAQDLLPLIEGIKSAQEPARIQIASDRYFVAPEEPCVLEDRRGAPAHDVDHRESDSVRCHWAVDEGENDREVALVLEVLSDLRRVGAETTDGSIGGWILGRDQRDVHTLIIDQEKDRNSKYGAGPVIGCFASER